MPQQAPNIDLPGAEYLALAPNRLVAIQGRRRFNAQAANVAVVANTTVNITEATAGVGNLIMETPFPQGAGIYIHYATLLAIPVDSSLQLQIVNAGLGFRTNTSVNTSFYPIGTNVLSFATPNAGQCQAVVAQDLFIPERDIELWTYPPTVSPSSLQAAFSLGLKNLDATNPHTITVAARYVYSRLDGIVE